MSMLVILLPARPHPADAGPIGPVPDDWGHVLSLDGLAVERQGRTRAAELPRADTVVAVVPATDVTWHQALMPKAPANRLREALGGVLEEQLLDDDDAVHLALAPKPIAGQLVWVAALNKPWLSAQLTALQAAGITVDRLAPVMAPAAAGGASAHVFLHGSADDADGAPAPWLAAADGQGSLCLPLAGGLARAKMPRWTDAGARVSATPAAAAAAEAWLGAPVSVLTEVEQALAAARSGWNLLQFDLAASTRGKRALADIARQWLSPDWRPARWGVTALVLAQVLGLNLWAWHQQRAISARKTALVQLLQATHPQVKAVLDAPLQMRSAGQQLRELAGVPGDTDFEPALAATAAAWPDGLPPAAQLRYDNGRLSLPANGWGPQQIVQLRQRLQPAGWSVDSTDGRVTLSRNAGG